MCFAPEMDLAAGIVITAVGIDTLRHVRTREQIAMASLPVVFGIHQLVETLVWWNLQGHVSDSIGDLAAWIYLAIAIGLVPVLVPYAFLKLGTVEWPRLAWVFLFAGVATATIDMIALGAGPVVREIDGYHVAYSIGLPHAALALTAYVFATCGPSLVSRSAALRWFGVGNLAVVTLLAWLDQNAVVSLWCVWAAITSILINVHARETKSAVESSARPIAAS